MRHGSVTVDTASLRRWYVDDWMTTADIAAKLGCGATTRLVAGCERLAFLFARAALRRIAVARNAAGRHGQTVSGPQH